MSRKKINNFMYVLKNPAGLPVGQFAWYSEALHRQKSKKGYTIVKREFVNGRWQDVKNPQLTI